MAYNDRGLNYIHKCKYEEAMRDIERAITMAPDNQYRSSAMNNRAVILFKLGRYKDAIKDLDIAIKLNGDNYLAYGNRSLINKNLVTFKSWGKG